VAARWAESFKFRGVVRNAMAALPLADGNMVALGATGRVSFAAELGNHVHTLRFNLGGRYQYTSRGETVSGAPNLFLPPGAHVRGGAEDARVLFVDIGCLSVERALGPRGRPEARIAELNGNTGLSLREAAVTACREADRLSGAALRLFLRNFQNAMAAAIADVLHLLSPCSRRPDPMIGRRKVAELCEWAALDHADPLTIGDLAAHCGLGLRALEKNFLRHLDTTPLVFLRNLRLDKARQFLQDETGAWSVTAAALEAGFAHFGRFAFYYREKFGELPRETRLRTAGRKNTE